MFCRRMIAENFRNIKFADIEFSDGVNVLVGNNAQGKTNLLEAIFYTALGRSFRQAKDSELIRSELVRSEVISSGTDGGVSDKPEGQSEGQSIGQRFATISNTFSLCGYEKEQNITMRLFSDRRMRYAEENHVKIGKMSQLVGAFRVVLFCPEHLSIIKNGPAERRNFLDVALSQLYPIYLQSLQKCNHILKQRGKLLKDANEDRRSYDETIELWSEQLAAECAVIAGYRYSYLQKISELVREIFSEMTGGAEIPEITYCGSSGQENDSYGDRVYTEKCYLRALTVNREREISAGVNLYGIHRDDININLNGVSSRSFASQGQQRSLSLALKLAEGEISRSVCGGDYPVFLFDDVMSELDASRRKFLLSKLGGRQVIMTACEDIVSDSADITDVCAGIFTKRK